MTPTKEEMTTDDGDDPHKRDWQHFYKTFNSKKGQNTRREWYDDITHAYRWARPKYPDDMLTQALTKPSDRSGDSEWPGGDVDSCISVLELGCGPGIVTDAILRLNLAQMVVAMDPSPAACALARECCAAVAKSGQKFSITDCTFEDYELDESREGTFDFVVAATSFHWIDPDVACRKSAAALKDGGGGRLVLLWATPPQPKSQVMSDLQAHVFDLVRDDVPTAASDCLRQAYVLGFEQVSKRVDDSGYFASPSKSWESKLYTSMYSIDKFIALLSSLSPYIALDNSVREDLFRRLRERLTLHTDTNGKIEMDHLYAYQVATKK